MLSTAKPHREQRSLFQIIYKLKSHEKDQRGEKERERSGLSNWLKVREEVSDRSRAGLQPWFSPLGCLPCWGKEIFGGTLPQILRIQTLTRIRSHALPPNFNGCIYVAEQGQPEAKLEVSCAAHPYYLLKHLQAGSRATLLILPGTKAQEYPMFSSMFKGTRVRVPARGILMGFNTTTEAIGIRLAFSAVRTSKSKPEQMGGGVGGNRRFWSQEQKVSLHQNLKALIRKKLAWSFSPSFSLTLSLKNPYNVKLLNSGGGSIHLLISKYFLLLCGACWLYCCWTF